MDKVKRVSEILKFRKGRPPKKATAQIVGEELPYLTPEYLRSGDTVDVVIVDSSSVIVEDGDLILLWDGSNAGEFFVGRKGILSSTMVVLKSNPDFEKRFLFFSLKRHEAFLKGQTSGSGIPHVDKEIFGDLTIALFGRDEQTLIATILSRVEHAIEQTEAIIAKQQRIKVGLMQNLLTKGIDEQGNVRSEETHGFKNSPLGKIPCDWDVVPIDKLKTSITSGSRGWAKYYSEEGALFLRIGNLTREHINLRLDDQIRVQPPETSEGRRTMLKKNDVLISITADLGIIGCIPKDFEGAYINQHIALVRINNDVINPRWVAYFLASDKGQRQFQMLNESGAKAGLNLPTVASLLVAKPKCENEQQQICDVLDKCFDRIESEKRRLKKLRSLKAGLMQDLLSGRKLVEALLESEHRTIEA